MSIILGSGVVTAIGGAAAAEDEEPDYEIGSVSAFDYVNSRGLEDKNGDGTIAVKVTADINLSESRDPLLTYQGDLPLKLYGSGGFKNAPEGVIQLAEPRSIEVPNLFTEAAVTVDGLTIRDVDGVFIRAAGPVTIRNSEFRHVGDVVATGEMVTILNSEFEDTGQIAEIDFDRDYQGDTPERVKISESTIADSDTSRQGVISAETTIISDSEFEHLDARFDVIRSNRVSIVDTELRAVENTIRAERELNIERATVRNSSAISASGEVQIVDSEIKDIGSIGGDGESTVEIRDSTIKSVGVISYGAGLGSETPVTVRDSLVEDSGRIHAGTVRFVGTTVKQSNGEWPSHPDNLFAYGRSIYVIDSEIEDSTGSVSLAADLSGSTLQDVDFIRTRNEITVQSSTFVSFGRFEDNPTEIRIEESTFYDSSSPLFPDIPLEYTQSFQEVNIIEAEAPIFADKLPDKTQVFVDTADDTESFGDWDADVYWSQEKPFRSAERLSGTAAEQRTVSPTPAAERTETPTQTPMATQSPNRANSEPTEIETEEPTTSTTSAPGLGIVAALASILIFSRIRKR